MSCYKKLTITNATFFYAICGFNNLASEKSKIKC